MRTVNWIPIYEVNGTEDPQSCKDLVVQSHGLHKGRVVLELGDQKITVLADDLQKAIQNAVNVR